MVLVWWTTKGIDNNYLLLAVRIVLAAILYAVVMKLLKVKMMDECVRFIKGKKVKK
jgi:hypothetical protein